MTKKGRQNKRLREGDTVVALVGNDKGRSGTILSRTESRVKVQGLNVRKKTVKRSETNPQGGFVEVEVAMDISNVRLQSKGGRAVSLKARTSENGEKELYYRESDGTEVVHRAAKKSK